MAVLWKVILLLFLKDKVNSASLLGRLFLFMLVSDKLKENNKNKSRF